MEMTAYDFVLTPSDSFLAFASSAEAGEMQTTVMPLYAAKPALDEDEDVEDEDEDEDLDEDDEDLEEDDDDLEEDEDDDLEDDEDEDDDDEDDEELEDDDDPKPLKVKSRA